MEVELVVEQSQVARRLGRATAVRLLGPVTALVGIVWAVAQPYRLTIIDRTGHGIWDHLAQAPLLVVLVGLVFHFAVARPLARELETLA